MKKNGFTLPEIMIVISIIGILAAILLPMTRNIIPNENIAKFKQTHNALLGAINEMVNSDKYFLNGDLRLTPNGACADSANYHINVLADILNAKKIMETQSGCSNTPSSNICAVNSNITFFSSSEMSDLKNGLDDFSNANYSPDKLISKATSNCSAALELTNGAQILFVPPKGNSLGYISMLLNFKFDDPSDGDATPKVNSSDENRIKQMQAGTISGGPVLSFSYALRFDGKIITSNKVDEWLEKSIQEKD